MSLRGQFRRFKRELRLYRNIMADPRTPRRTKLLLGLAVTYAVSPVDLIPDYIPVLGHLDDLVVVPVLVWLALRTISRGLLEEHRRAMDERAPEPPRGCRAVGTKKPGAHEAHRA